MGKGYKERILNTLRCNLKLNYDYVSVNCDH